MYNSKDITEREKACIYYAVFAGIEDIRTIWQISRNTAVEDRDPRKNPSVVTSWKNSAKIKNYFEEVKREKARREEETRNQARKEYELELLNREQETGEETEPTKGKKGFSEIVNFQDKSQFLQYLNKQANLIQDPKLKADYLKMLSDLLRFKESETGKDNEIQRFYTPISCNNCPLYQAKSDIKTE